MNYMKITFKAVPENEAFIRTAVAGFLLYLNPNIEDLTDIKTAVSESVTNVILYAYDEEGDIDVICSEENKKITISVKDYGKGIDNIEKAREPFYSTDLTSERAGLGFVMMDSFMDSLDIKSEIGKGTEIIMTKQL